MKNALVYMTFLFLLTGMLGGCTDVSTKETETINETMPVEMDVDTTTSSAVDTTSSETRVEATTDQTATVTVYKDGSYSKTGNYLSPAGSEDITVTLTITDDVITGVQVTPLAQDYDSRVYQERFAGGIASVVNGVRLEDLTDVSAVNGSSLTSKGFNQALIGIKAEARN